MTVNVIGCGPSGANWNGKGYSIGVNDCQKFGNPVDRLIVVNQDFEPERMSIIQQSRPKDGLWSQLAFWTVHPCYKHLFTKQFHHVASDKYIYHSISSPFIAVSMAAFMGADDIVMWGVDFTDHPVVNGDRLNREVDTYVRYIELLRVRGITVSLGTKTGVFKGKI